MDGGWLGIRNRTGSGFNLLLRKSKFILFYVSSAAAQSGRRGPSDNVGTHQVPERSVPVFFIFFPDPKRSSLYRVDSD